LRRATAFVSGLGHFELQLDGRKVGDHFLDPGWVAYDKKALYVGFDITNELKQGKNAVGVMLGNGFYYVPGERYHKLLTAYGYPKMIARIILEYQDGRTEDVVSDASWKAAAGPVTYSSIYGGEDYDARLEGGQGWRSAVVVKGPPVLEAQEAEPLRVMEELGVRRKIGSNIYDLGQNASGIVRIKVRGPRGSVVRITPAELLSGDSVNQKATGKPYYWEYTLKGDGEEVWEPRFTYYGFRYLQVDGNAEVVDNRVAYAQFDGGCGKVQVFEQFIQQDRYADRLGDKEQYGECVYRLSAPGEAGLAGGGASNGEFDAVWL